VELVYLWVEDYKNIKNQGFNFSPRFRCDFRAEYEEYSVDNKIEKRLKDNCELIIKDRQKEYFHVFPENINVAAIVGKNGSGKSSVSKIIFFLIAHRYFNNPNYRDSSAPARLLKNTLLDSTELILILYDNGFKKITFRHYVLDYEEAGLRYLTGGPDSIININSCENILELQQNEISFFSIHINYQIDTWFDWVGDDWVRNLYHRVDGYLMPLLLEPYKGHRKQIIDIDNLEFLTTQKIFNFYSNITSNKTILSFFNPNAIKYKFGIVYSKDENGNHEALPKLVDKFTKLKEIYNSSFAPKPKQFLRRAP